MRLLDTSTRKLVAEDRTTTGPYAILSHTWHGDEVIFEDVINETEHYKSAESQLKIRRACEQAKSDSYRYIWIDTCCIDKSNAAVLSEAINSMYAWYRDADVCYAFLDDAPDDINGEENKAAFARSRWFTRGWTLQELVAPSKVVFFSENWQCLGDKRAISPILARITGIDEPILTGEHAVGFSSVAKRMSWASRRETKKPEDLAYCLIGLFGVNMPMLYGEGGERAFLRLQEEIMKVSDDQSLFAWANDDLGYDPDATHGLLARSPRDFFQSNQMLPYQDWEFREPYTMTNRGLRINLHLTALGDDIFLAALDCPVPPHYQDSTFLGIYLRKLSSSDAKDLNGQRYARVRLGRLGSVRTRGKLTWIYVRQTPQAPVAQGLFPHHILQLRFGPSTQVYRLEKVVHAPSDNEPSSLPLKQSARTWVPTTWPVVYSLRKGAAQLTAAFIFTRDDGESLAVLVGSVEEFKVGFDAIPLQPNGGTQGTSDVTLQDLENAARLSASGRIETEFHSVRCSVIENVLNSQKYFIVDIGIEDIKRSVRLRDILAAAAEEALGRALVAEETRDEEPKQIGSPKTVGKSNRRSGLAFWKQHKSQ